MKCDKCKSIMTKEGNEYKCSQCRIKTMWVEPVNAADKGCYVVMRFPTSTDATSSDYL